MGNSFLSGALITRNRGEKEKEKIVSQNKFKMLTSRMMQCEVEKRIIKR